MPTSSSSPRRSPATRRTSRSSSSSRASKAKVFGGDGANDATSFKMPGSYVSNFAPDIAAIAYNRAIIAGWKKDNPRATLGSFGPPTYLAVQVALNAIKRGV